VKPIPKLLKHNGILTNWRTYPAGSIERAKALGLEVLFVRKRLSTTLELWESQISVVDAEQAWIPLGLQSRDEYVHAILGETDQEIRQKITKTEAIRARRAEHPDETQQATADAVGCSQQMVAKVDQMITTKLSETDKKVVIPEWICDREKQAAFRRLPSSEQQRLVDLPPDQRRGAVRRAAIDAGIIRLPTPLDQGKKAFNRMDDESRCEFAKWILCWLDSPES